MPKYCGVKFREYGGSIQANPKSACSRARSKGYSASRESRKAASFIDPGKVYEFTIDLLPTSNMFLPRHRIRVEISSINFPRFDRKLNTGGDARPCCSEYAT